MSATNVLTLSATLGLDASAYNSGLATASASAKGFGTTAGGVFKGVMGASLFTQGAKAVVGFGKDVVETGMSIEKTFSQVQATMGLSSKEFEEIQVPIGNTNGSLKDLARTLAKDTVYTTTEAGDAMNYMALAGYKAEDIASMLPSTLKFAAAANMDLAKATDNVTDVQSALNLSNEETIEMMNQWAKTSTLTNTSVEQIGEAFLRLGATAGSLGFDTADLSASFGILASSGIKGAEAGTHMRNMLLKLTDPTDDGAVALEELGVSLYDDAGKARNLGDVFGDLSNKMSWMSDETKFKTLSSLFNTRDLSSAITLMKAAGDTIDVDTKKLVEATIPWDEYGLSASKAGEAVDMAMSYDISSEEGLLAYIEELQDGFGLTAEDAQLVADTIIMNNAEVVSSYKDLESEIDGCGDALEEMYERQTDNLQGDVDKLKSTFEAVKDSIYEGVSPALRDLAQTGTEVLNAFLSGDLGKIGETFRGILDGILNLITEKLPEFVNSGLDMLVSLSEGFLTGIPDALNNWWDGLRGIVDMLSEQIPIWLEKGREFVLNLAQGFANALPDFFAKVPALIRDFANLINDNVPTILKTGVEILITLGKGLISAIPEFVANIPTIIQAVVSVFFAFNWVNLGKSLITFITNGVKSLSTSIPQALKEIGAKALELFKGINWKGLGSSVINLLKGGITSAPTLITNALKGLGTTALNAFKNINWLGLGKNVVQGIINGLKAMGSSLITAMLSLARNAFSAVKKFFHIESPSKLMRDQIGKNVVLGFAGGIDKYADDAVASAQELSEDVANAFSAGEISPSYDFGKVEDFGNVGENEGNTINYGGTTINVYASEGMDINALAEVIQQKINNNINRRLEVWA